MSNELDLDDELIWESYTQEDEIPYDEIEYYLSDGNSVDETAEYFDVDERVVRDIQRKLFDPDEDDYSDEDEELLKSLKLDKEDVLYKSTSMNEDIPSDKVNPKGEGEEWYSNRNTAGVPDVKPQKKRGGKIGRLKTRLNK